MNGQNKRRAFLKQGALVLGFSLLPAAAWAELNALGLPPLVDARLPGSLKNTPLLDAWIRVDADGKVTVCSGKVELGTGVRTALMQIALEQLELGPGDIRFIGGDTSLTPNEGFTAGSHTIPDSGTALLHASAQVAALLRAGAAAQWQVDADTVALRAGRAVARDGRSMHYGDAVKGLRAPGLHRAATPASPLRDPAHYRLIGKPVPRVDIPAKVAGGAAYVQDMRPPGMLHARVVRPPRLGARLVDANLTSVLAAVRRLPGVRQVVRDGSYLAVLAEGEWQAIVAMNALAGKSRWEGGTPLPLPRDIHATLQALPAQDIVILKRGTLGPTGGPTVAARFTKQYVLHGSIGPSCAVGHLADGVLTVWTHTQGVYPLRAALAELVRMPLERVRCIHTEGSGCYGQNGADDVAADAALLACAMPGTPVRVQLMRDQENLWEPYAPAMVTSVRAALDANGRIAQWQYELWSGSHNERPGNAGKLVPAWLLAKPIQPSRSEPMLQPEGGGDRNALPLYDIPNAHVVNHFLPVTPLRTSAMRSLGAHINIVTIESTMEQLAQLAGADSVRFRLDHLADAPRARAVIERAAAMFGWQPNTVQNAGRPARDARNRGVGFGFGQYKNLMAYVAIALELEYDPDRNSVRIVRVACAADCGQVVNPDGARNQLEGAIIQSASWTLNEHLRYGPDGIESFDWSTYPILRFSGVPAQIDVAIIDQPGQPFLGVAEAAQGPMAAALANALAQATGTRRHDLPLLAHVAPT